MDTIFSKFFFESRSRENICKYFICGQHKYQIYAEKEKYVKIESYRLVL